MCKYCKLTVCNKTIGEETNRDGLIISVKDGSQIIDCSISRDICESENFRSNHLMLDLSVKIDSFVYPVKSKAIKIKYCPFCGEKL